jgi:hypothetical protein
MIDLNAFVPPGSGVTLTEATFISDNGEISVQAVHSNGDTHAALLIPCDSEGEGCQDGSARLGTSKVAPAARGQLVRYQLPRRAIGVSN